MGLKVLASRNSDRADIETHAAHLSLTTVSQMVDLTERVFDEPIDVRARQPLKDLFGPYRDER